MDIKQFGSDLLKEYVHQNDRLLNSDYLYELVVSFVMCSGDAFNCAG